MGIIKDNCDTDIYIGLFCMCVQWLDQIAIDGLSGDSFSIVCHW